MRHELERTNALLIAEAVYRGRRRQINGLGTRSLNEAFVANEIQLSNGPAGGIRAGMKPQFSLVANVASEALSRT